MKPEKLSFDEPDKLQVVQQVPDKTTAMVGSIVPFRGHTTFEIDCTTGVIVEAKYEEINATFGGSVKKKILTKPNCVYISALNKKNAGKKFFKWLIEKSKTV